MNNYLKISIPVQVPGLADMLIAQLSEMGYDAFEEDTEILHAFIPEKDFNEQALVALATEFKFSFLNETIIAKNWNEEWENNFQPVIVDHFCAVRAAFHQPVIGVQHELIITPKMSFGTGHHATTFLVIQMMEQLDFKGRSVLDFGTGTGILSILAAMLGANDLLAIDIDDWSIENARENAALNETSNIRIVQAAQIPDSERFEIILANINKNVILANMAFMSQQLENSGVLILSGLLEDDFDEIKIEAIKNNLYINNKLSKENWICLTLIKQFAKTI